MTDRLHDREQSKATATETQRAYLAAPVDVLAALAVQDN
jgi:hypothetical protein